MTQILKPTDAMTRRAREIAAEVGPFDDDEKAEILAGEDDGTETLSGYMIEAVERALASIHSDPDELREALERIEAIESGAGYDPMQALSEIIAVTRTALSRNVGDVG